MIITIHEATNVNTGRNDRKTNTEIKEPNAVFLYNRYMKGLDKQKIKNKNFQHEVGRSWISEFQNGSESSSDGLQLPEKQTTPKGPKQDPPDRLSGDFRIHKFGEKKKFFGGGKKKELSCKTVSSVCCTEGAK